MKQELTQEQKDFRLDPITLNRQFEYWIVKSKCLWNLRDTNKKYDKLRLENDHAISMEILKREMFNVGQKMY